ncbi:hypothetical protein LRP52_37080 [Photobacterium sp. ZSDE20]|uniref:Uncharacterized protein n=1 Tax=Photobacterium pectinilyticum TaxID=2906793 RepID=A0ABT1N779_9GAMM|nr:hypothetical protein [Photobacterium sp. ZSDE20]MCQ1060606.1 hypothetical protein [Photobacterium sp. ZSDE20]MDD1827801.1 hypothetical protein [Photobacterium sp. ZSDE20]
MSEDKTKRLSPQEMREVLLTNAKVLASDRFRTSAPEISGQRKVSTTTP